MDLGSAVVADVQPLVVVQVSEGPLDDPTHAAEPRAVLGLAAGDDGSNAPLADEAAVRIVVVAAVGDDRGWATTRSADDGRAQAALCRAAGPAG